MRRTGFPALSQVLEQLSFSQRAHVVVDGVVICDVGSYSDDGEARARCGARTDGRVLHGNRVGRRDVQSSAGEAVDIGSGLWELDVVGGHDG